MAKSGLRVYTVGIGDKEKGGKIPIRDGYLVRPDNGEAVITKLDEKPLRTIAAETKGTFTLAGTDPPRLAALFRNTIDAGDKSEVLDDAIRPYRQRYPWFFGAALFFLSAEMMLGRSVRQRAVAPKPKSSRPAPVPRVATRFPETVS